MTDTTSTQDAPKRPRTQLEMEQEAGRRRLQQVAKSREAEGQTGRDAAKVSAENHQRAAQDYQSGQETPPPVKQDTAPAPQPNFETVVIPPRSEQSDKPGEGTTTQGSAPNAGTDTGDRVNRNPANHPDQALVATATNDANAGEEAKEVTVMDRTSGTEAGPMVQSDTTKTGPSGVNIGGDNREAVEQADQRQSANEAFNAKAEADQKKQAEETNQNEKKASDVQDPPSEDEKAKQADAAATAKAARDKAVADAEAKAKAKSDAAKAKKDDKSSAVDDVLK